ncbi:hypothetical protein K438DRAFT_1802286 [Mycena galopus ATCC 62051]|nr:hypothetical protein K438DRAFT_1802286 [Mycena galopus ATCC 62051]
MRIRLAPTNYLLIVPTEIWLACWTLCSLRQLRRLSLVCKLFRSLVLPHLFRQLTFDVMALANGLDQDNWMNRVRHLHRTAVRLDRLAEGPLRPFVRTWNVTFSGAMDLSHSYQHIQNIHLFDTLSRRTLKTFITTLLDYRNVSSLHIGCATIDSAFREALRSLPKLADLRLAHCTILEAEGRLTLPRLSIRNCSPVALVHPEALHILDIAPDISRPFAEFRSDWLLNLLDLSVHDVRDAAELFNFLARCPRVHSLSISKMSHNIPLPAIQLSVIPLLRNITAPHALGQLFTPGRPVIKVVVTDSSPDPLMPMLTDMARSTAHLQCLHLHCQSPTLNDLATLASLLPELQELFFCGFNSRRRKSRRADTPLDLRTLELNDEMAFAGELPADEISDVELEGDPAPTTSADILLPQKMLLLQKMRSQSMLRNVCGWLNDGSLLLPPNIEVFRVDDPNGLLSPASQHQTIEVLSRLYTHLREVKFASLEDGWKRTGNAWAREISRTREMIEAATAADL